MRIHRDSFDIGVGMFNAERTQSNPKNGADSPDIEVKVGVPTRLAQRYRSAVAIKRAASRWPVVEMASRPASRGIFAPAKSSAFDRNPVERARRRSRAQEATAIGIFRRLRFIFIFSCVPVGRSSGSFSAARYAASAPMRPYRYLTNAGPRPVSSVRLLQDGVSRLAR